VNPQVNKIIESTNEPKDFFAQFPYDALSLILHTIWQKIIGWVHPGYS
jgi:hypothetical protein